MLQACDRCGGDVDRLGVCGACGRHTPLTAHERIGVLATGFVEQDAMVAGGDPLRFDGYAEAARAARATTGLGEAAVWGFAQIGAQRCALVVLDFRFLGGSMGVAVGEKVARAYEGAVAEELPLVAVTGSGGARMQEGMVSLVQMAKTAEARRRHAHAGLGQVTLLTSPTTGGVYASFGSLADIVFAEPDAHVGFAGPRVVRELTGTAPPPDVHTAGFAREHGLVDDILARDVQVETIASALRNLAGAPAHRSRTALPKLDTASPPDAWRRVKLARAARRPKGPAILDAILTDAVELRGDRSGGGEDPSVIVRLGALTRTGDRVVAIAQDASGDGRMSPAGFRTAMRAIALAGRTGLPLVTLVDTKGADPLPASEGSGVAAAIAETFVAMLDCPAPTVCAVTGEGGSGGALAMAVADRVLVWRNAFFSVIAPEGAASILYRDATRAAELAARMRITAEDLLDLGIADRIVEEPPGGAQAAPAEACAVLGAAIAEEVAALRSAPAPSRLGNRRRRWRRAGSRWLRPL